MNHPISQPQNATLNQPSEEPPSRTAQNTGPLFLPVYFDEFFTTFPFRSICSFFFKIHAFPPFRPSPLFPFSLSLSRPGRPSTTSTPSIPLTTPVISPPAPPPPPTVNTKYSFPFFVPGSSSSTPAPNPAFTAAALIMPLCASFFG